MSEDDAHTFRSCLLNHLILDLSEEQVFGGGFGSDLMTLLLWTVWSYLGKKERIQKILKYINCTT